MVQTVNFPIAYDSIIVEWLSNLFVTERTKVSNFDTSSISMYSVRKISAPKKMADVPRIRAV